MLWLKFHIEYDYKTSLKHVSRSKQKQITLQIKCDYKPSLKPIRDEKEDLGDQVRIYSKQKDMEYVSASNIRASVC